MAEESTSEHKKTKALEEMDFFSIREKLGGWDIEYISKSELARILEEMAEVINRLQEEVDQIKSN